MKLIIGFVLGFLLAGAVATIASHDSPELLAMRLSTVESQLSTLQSRVSIICLKSSNLCY